MSSPSERQQQVHSHRKKASRLGSAEGERNPKDHFG